MVLGWLVIAAHATNLSGAPSDVAGVVAPVPPAGQSLMALTDEIRTWLHTHVSAVGTEDERMRRLLTALTNHGLVYTNAPTGTASEVFATRRFNCLGLSHLVVGLARELGVDAYYVRVEELRTYHQRENLVLVST